MPLTKKVQNQASKSMPFTWILYSYVFKGGIVKPISECGDSSVRKILSRQVRGPELILVLYMGTGGG